MNTDKLTYNEYDDTMGHLHYHPPPPNAGNGDAFLFIQPHKIRMALCVCACVCVCVVWNRRDDLLVVVVCSAQTVSVNELAWSKSWGVGRPWHGLQRRVSSMRPRPT